MTKIRIVGDSADSARILAVLSSETITQGHLFAACTSLLRTSQPKDFDFRREKVRVMKRCSCIMPLYRCMGALVELYRMVKKAI